MTDPSVCPACGDPLPDDAGDRRVWCSDGCRAWVAEMGGPEEAAARLEEWAAEWAAVPAVVMSGGQRRAAKLRELAGQLRELSE